jgi:hypothetical protein
MSGFFLFAFMPFYFEDDKEYHQNYVGGYAQ